MTSHETATRSLPTRPTPTEPDARAISTRRFTTLAAALAAASLLGGGAALAGAWALGAFDEPAAVADATPTGQGGAGATSGSTTIDVAEIYRRNSPGVVQVTSLGGDTAQQSLGSGFVIDKEGHIVTNFHVVDGATEIQVGFSNQDTVSARVVGTDQSTDLALLEVDADATALTPLSLADSDVVEVGDPVVAIGNPFGLERTATAGIVSALQREVRAPNDYTIDQVIQTDAPINSGNSGGPLIDASGRVIGVNSQIETAGAGGGNVGIGFAVPSNTVKSVVAQLLEDGRVDRAYLGVTLQEIDADVADALDLPADEGVLVGSVQQGSAAGDAGVRGGGAQRLVAGRSYTVGGDMIVAIDGEDVASVDALRGVLLKHEPGDTVELTLVHANGERETVTAKLGRVPETTTP